MRGWWDTAVPRWFLRRGCCEVTHRGAEGAGVCWSQDPTNGVAKPGVLHPLPPRGLETPAPPTVHSVSFPRSPGTARNKLN